MLAPRTMRCRFTALCCLVIAGCGAKTGLAAVERGRDAEGVDGGRSVDASFDAASPPACGEGDVVVRYDASGRPVPARVDLRTSIRIPAADVYFLIDTTGSMTEEIRAMRAAVLELIEALTCPASDRTCSDERDCATGETCTPEGRCASAPEVAGCLPDLNVGVGRYAGGPESYVHLLDVAPPSEATRDAVPLEADGRGSNEALYNSVRCSLGRGRCTGMTCDGEGRDCVGYRRHALPILVAITDEGDECTYGRFSECAATPENTGADLRENGVVFVGIDADSRGDREATPFLEALAVEAGSLDAAGDPLVFAGTGSDVVRAVQDGLGSVTGSPLRLEVALEERDADDGDALALVDHVEIDTASEGCFEYRDVEDTDGDGFADAVPAAGPGTTGCFVVVPRARPPGFARGVYVAGARLLAGGATVDDRTICFEVL